MADINDFVGIPYDPDGINCWVLCVKVLKEIFGIDVKVHNNVKRDEVNVHQSTLDEIKSGKWEKVDEPREGSIVLMSSKGSNTWDHIGVYFGTNQKYVIHTMSQSGQSVMNELKILQRAFRKVEFYNYVCNN